MIKLNRLLRPLGILVAGTLLIIVSVPTTAVAVSGRGFAQLLLPKFSNTMQGTPTAPPVPREMRAIRAADLRRDLFAMASPAMRGREGGTLDELVASIWVAEQYAKIGLEPAGENGTWFQWFNIVRTRVSSNLTCATVRTS